MSLSLILTSGRQLWPYYIIKFHYCIVPKVLVQVLFDNINTVGETSACKRLTTDQFASLS